MAILDFKRSKGGRPPKELFTYTRDNPDSRIAYLVGYVRCETCDRDITVSVDLEGARRLMEYNYRFLGFPKPKETLKQKISYFLQNLAKKLSTS